MSIDDITARLALIAQQIEAHRTAIWLLEDEQAQLRQKLRAANFQPPPVCADVPVTAEHSTQARGGGRLSLST